MLDVDGSILKTYFFSHASDKEILAQDPRHVPWKGQLEMLPLSAENRSLLNSRIFQFSLKTHLVSLAQLDREWIEITKFALKLAGVSALEYRMYSLPSDVRLGGTESDVFSGQQLEEAIEPSVVELTDAIDWSIATRTQLKHKFQELTTALCSSESTVNDVSMQALLREMEHVSISLSRLKHKKGRRRESLLMLVSKRMEKIYRLAPYWCQRICCQGFTMARKSSSWSEAINSMIRRDIVPERVILRHSFGMLDFIQAFDSWVDQLCNKAYLAYRDNKKSHKVQAARVSNRGVHLFTPEQESQLDRFVTAKALHTIIQNSVIQHHNFTFLRSSELSKESVSSEIRERVSALCSCMGIREQSEQIKYLKPNPICVQATPIRCIDSDFVDPLVAKATLEVNKDCDAVLAVYIPSLEDGCVINSFNSLWEKQVPLEIVLYCSCQQGTSRGLPCQHQLQYIILSPSRNMDNIIWLCHPTYLRGHRAQ